MRLKSTLLQTYRAARALRPLFDRCLLSHPRIKTDEKTLSVCAQNTSRDCRAACTSRLPRSTLSGVFGRPIALWVISLSDYKAHHLNDTITIEVAVQPLQRSQAAPIVSEHLQPALPSQALWADPLLQPILCCRRIRHRRLKGRDRRHRTPSSKPTSQAR